MFDKSKKIRIGLVLSVALLVTIGYLTIPTPKIEQKEDTKTWHVIWEGSLAEAAEGNPGTGASGFLEIFFVNHSAVPGTVYAYNTTSTYETWANANLAGSGNAWANADDFNLDIKHSVLMDVLVRGRFNRTHVWNGTMFRAADCRVNITGSGGGITISGTVSGTLIATGNNTAYQYLFVNVYWNNGGSGYTLNKGGTFTITSISFQAKY